MSECKEPPSKRSKTDVNEKNTEENATEDFTEDLGKEDERFTEDDDKCKDFVSPEELERLSEFKILDEVKSNDEDSNEDDSDSSDGVPEEEIEKMLEENLPDDYKEAPKPKEKAYVTRQKVVLEEKGVNQFEVLPLDWMMVRHYSGMPIYMHRTTRVCTLSKPYFLGKGNTRRHEIPISAIPCLAYRKALEEEEKQNEIDREMEEKIKSGTWQQLLNKSNKSDSQSKPTDKADDKNVHESAKDKLKCPFQHAKTSDSQLNSEVHSNEYDKESAKTQDYVEAGQDESKECEDLTEHLKMDIESVKNDINSEETFTNENYDKSSTHKIIDDNVIDTIDITTATDDQKGTKQSTDEFSSNKDKIDAENNSVEESNDDENATGETSQANSEGTETTEIPLNRQPVVLPGGIVMPPPRVETVSTSWKTQHLTHDQVNNYCKKLFKFKTVNIMHFKRWADRRKYTKARKTLQYPTLPEGTKLITIPAQLTAGQDNAGKANKRDWVMNMNGRSYLSVFHEYVFRALQKQPTYEFKQLENAATPYQATVYIGGMQYGVGHGSSKRSAKAAAARASIHILIPEMREQLEPSPSEPDFSFFDYVGIEDPRITEFCAATCEPSPHAILRTCLLRNFGAGDKQIQTQMKKLEYQKIELTMTVGKHSATVVCKNKKTAKQRASQAILQALHPHVRSWGSLLRLYGSRSVKSCKEKKQEEQQITLLQDSAKAHQPNHAVLAKLRQEMRKLAQRDAAVVPLGTLKLDHDLPTHSASNLNNVDL